MVFTLTMQKKSTCMQAVKKTSHAGG